MPQVLLSLGSNIEPARYLSAAAQALREQFPDVIFSAPYQYAAVGFDGPAFVNAGALLETDMAPEPLNDWLHALEDANGRRRDVPRYSSRTLDIDLVFYGAQVLEGPGNLKVPRRELQHAFVLQPLAEIAPDFIDPLSGQRLANLWDAHPDRATPSKPENWVL